MLRKQFIARYQSQFPKAVKALDRNWDRMLTFLDFPEEHWRHLRTTNVVEGSLPPSAYEKTQPIVTKR